MNNQNNKFETLIGYARSILGYSFEELKRRYINHPISITVHVDKKINAFEKVIEVRFDNQEATISCSFDEFDKCNIGYLFFDIQTDENEFIEYLRKNYEFDFRKNYWEINNCYLKIRSTIDFFCFYFFR